VSVACERGHGRPATPIEVLVATATAIAAAVAVSRHSAWGAGLQWLWVPCLWVAAGVLPTMLRRQPLGEIGLRTTRAWLALRLFGWTVLAVMPALFLGVFVWRRYGLPLPLQPGPTHGRWALWVVYQLFYVAVAEETFFRGYVQSNVTRWLVQTAPHRQAACRVLGPVVSALLFALAHVAIVGPAGAVVFFPGLLFGWLRARTGSLLAPILFHATANVGYAVACATA